MAEFWNDSFTDESWKALLQLRKDADFVLIGGWACYLLTGAIKSKDIDIIVGHDALLALRAKYAVKNTAFLKKYEAAAGNISIDIYVPHYSKLAVPVAEIMAHTRIVEGFKVPEPEILVLLKQGAELDRSASIKGQKDRADILNLLVNAHIDFAAYARFAELFGLAQYPRRLREIVAGARKEFEYLGKNPREAKLLRADLMDRLKFT
jgi:hypothetical protein